MQAAEPANQLMAGPQVKMIGVGEKDFGAEFFKGFLREGFDGSLRPDRQEKRSLNDAMRRDQAAAARASGVGFQDFKRKTHPPSVSGEDEGPTHATKDIHRPDGERYSVGFCAFQLFGIHRGKSNGQQNQSPEHKDVK